MKTLMLVLSLTLAGTAMANATLTGQQPDALNCSCPSGTCPGYDAVKCGHLKDRQPFNNRAEASSTTKKKGKSATASGM